MTDPSLIALLLAALLASSLLALFLLFRNQSLRRAAGNQAVSNDLIAQRLQDIFEKAAVGISQIESLTGRYVMVNRKFCEIVGFSRKELMQMSFQQITHPDDVGVDLDQIRRMIAGENNLPPWEKRYLHRDKHTVWVRISVSRLDADEVDTPHHLVIIEDITDRKLAEQRIEEQRSFLEALIESAPIPLYYKDTAGTYLMCNRAFEEFHGMTRDQVVGRSVNLFASGNSAQDAQAHDTAVMEQDGNEPLSVTRSRFNGKGELRQVVLTKAPFRSKDGKVAGLIGGIMDITELKEREHQLEAKNAEVERFTYMVSHDLKSPVVTIKNYLGVLQEDMQSGNTERIEEDLYFMQSAADHMAELLEDLLNFVKTGQMSGENELTNFQSVVISALDTVAGSLLDRNLAIQIEERDIPLYGDVIRLVEIWQNLIENAIKFTAENPAPQIVIGAEDGADGVAFFVRDNGVGISPSYHRKIFNLFEKLDQNSSGSGLGLALVKRTVESYAGHISVESDGAGKGTCFRFTLPRACQMPDPLE